MKNLTVGLCLMTAFLPLALAQQNAKIDGAHPAVKAEKRVKVRKPPTPKQLAHQQRMKDCSRKAADQRLKGPDRRQFMKTCLKG